MRWMVSIAGKRISPVLEQAGGFLCVDTLNGCRTDEFSVCAQPGECLRLIQTVGEQAPDVLLCGALCTQLYCMIARDGLDIRPFLCGDAEQLLDRCIRSQPLSDDSYQPGCEGLARRRYPNWTSWPFTTATRGVSDGS